MSQLSISKAWDETAVVLARDGRLFASVALALIVFPATVLGAFYPGGLGAVMYTAMKTSSLGLTGLVMLVFLVILAGQLAITRLAIGPSITVGGAISHAVRRLPSYVGVALLLGAALLVAIIIGAAIIAMTVNAQVSEEELARSPAVAVVVLLVFALYLFLLTRVISVAAAVTATEELGPLRIIRRAWTLTSGHFLRLFGFIVLFLIGTTVAIFAVVSVVGLGTRMLLGEMEPMSASALVLALVAGILNGAVVVVFAVMLSRIYLQLTGAAGAQPSVPSSGA
jgi:hypothetical protein